MYILHSNKLNLYMETCDLIPTPPPWLNTKMSIQNRDVVGGYSVGCFFGSFQDVSLYLPPAIGLSAFKLRTQGAESFLFQKKCFIMFWIRDEDGKILMHACFILIQRKC